VILDEFLIETDEEDPKITRMFTSHATRLRQGKSEDDEDDLKEALENAFISLQFGNARKQN
jgi:hypothetical protein